MFFTRDITIYYIHQVCAVYVIKIWHVPCMDLMGWSLVREAIIRIAMTAQLGSIYPLTVSLELFEPSCLWNCKSHVTNAKWHSFQVLLQPLSVRFPSSRNLQVMKRPLLPQPPGPLLSKEGPSNTRSQGLGINMVRGCLDGRFGSWGFIGTDPWIGWRFVFGEFCVCESKFVNLARWDHGIVVGSLIHVLNLQGETQRERERE